MAKDTPIVDEPPAGAGLAIFLLPPTGEALLTDRQVAAALNMSQSQVWVLSKDDPDFPRPVRRGERFTRWKLSEIRDYVANMVTGTPKPAPTPKPRDWSSVRVPI